MGPDKADVAVAGIIAGGIVAVITSIVVGVTVSTIHDMDAKRECVAAGGSTQIVGEHWVCVND